jgi:hypothetical protein
MSNAVDENLRSPSGNAVNAGNDEAIDDLADADLRET